MVSTSSNADDDGREERNLQQDTPPTEDGRRRLSLMDRLRLRFPHDSLRGRFLRGAVWSTVGTVASRGLTLVSAIAVVRILGKTTYGELGMVLATVMMFTAYASMRWGLTAAKHVAEFRAKEPARAGRIAGLSLVVAALSGGVVTVIAIALAPYLARHVINAPHLTGLIQLGSIMLLLEAMSGAQRGALIGLEAFRTTAKVNCLTGVVTFSLMLIGTYFFHLTGAVCARLAISAFSVLAHTVAMRKNARRCGITISFRGIRQELPVLWRFSLPALLGGLIVAPAIWCTCAILANQPKGYDEIAVFTAARQWWGFLLILPQLLSQMNLPILTERYGASDWCGVRKVLFANMGLNAALTFPAALIITILSSYIMTLYGSSFSIGASTLTLLVWSAALAAIQQPLAQVFAASSRMWLSFLVNCCWVAIMLVSFLYLREWGAVGLGLSFLIAYSCYTSLTALIAWRLVRSGPVRSVASDIPSEVC